MTAKSSRLRILEQETWYQAIAFTADIGESIPTASGFLNLRKPIKTHNYHLSRRHCRSGFLKVLLTYNITIPLLDLFARFIACKLYTYSFNSPSASLLALCQIRSSQNTCCCILHEIDAIWLPYSTHIAMDAPSRRNTAVSGDVADSVDQDTIHRVLRSKRVYRGPACM